MISNPGASPPDPHAFGGTGSFCNPPTLRGYYRKRPGTTLNRFKVEVPICHVSTNLKPYPRGYCASRILLIVPAHFATPRGRTTWTQLSSRHFSPGG